MNEDRNTDTHHAPPDTVGNVRMQHGVTSEKPRSNHRRAAWQNAVHEITHSGVPNSAGMTESEDKTEPASAIMRTLSLAGLRTSVKFEPIIWLALTDICDREKISLNALCALIDEKRGVAGLTASIRTFVISYYMHISTRTDESRTRLGTDRLMDIFARDSSGAGTRAGSGFGKMPKTRHHPTRRGKAQSGE